MQCLLLVLQLVTASYACDVMIYLTKQLGTQMKKMCFIDASKKIFQSLVKLSSERCVHVLVTGP